MSSVEFQFVGCGDAFGSGGRFNTCFMVRSKEQNFLIDCGASSLVGMKKLGIDPLEVDTIFLTHLHGDHFAGVVFFLMDSRYVGQRQKPLKIVGPKGLEARIIETMNCLYPGCWDKGYDFPVHFIEMTAHVAQTHDNISLMPYKAKHLADGNDFILRFDVDGKRIVYSGDTGWTPELSQAAHQADLLVVESFHFDETCPFHLDYQTIKSRQQDLQAKKIILTHLGPKALAHTGEMAFQVAEDGLKLSL